MSKIALVNRTLSLIGANRLTSFEDTSEECHVINAVFTDSLKSILSETSWAFALKLDRLIKNENESSFPLPSNLVRLFRVYPLEIPYVVRGKELYAEQNKVAIEYTAYTEDDSLYPPYFKDAFAYRLAIDICYDLTNNAGRVSELMSLYEGHYLPLAVHKNSRERRGAEIIDDFWSNAAKVSRWG